MLEQPVDNQIPQESTPAVATAPSPAPQETPNDIVAKAVVAKKTNPLYIGVVVIVIAAALAAGYYFTGYKNGGFKLTYNAYHFAALDKVSVLGDEPGHAATFVKPQEFIAPYNQGAHKQSADFYFYQVNNHHTQTAGIISFSSSGTPLRTEEFLKGYGINLMHPKENLYDATVAPVKQTVSSRLGPTYSVKYDNAEEFQSPGTGKYAWSIGFTATKVKDNVASPEKMQGRMILALSNTGAYYLMMASEQASWQANQTTWQAVANSLKIDQ